MPSGQKTGSRLNNGDDRFTMVGPDNEIPLSYDRYKAMKQLPMAIEHDDEDPYDLALLLAQHGVITEHTSSLMSAYQRSKRSDNRPRLSNSAHPSTLNPQPSTDPQPAPSSAPEKPKRKRSRRRMIGNIAIGLTTALLAGWFAWCGIDAWQNDPQVSSIKSQASNQVVYQTVDIETLQPGDTVIAMNPETGEVAAKKVLQTFERVADHIYYLFFESDNGDIQVIETTDEHPFWVESEKAWKKAMQLELGDQVMGPNSECQSLVLSQFEAYPNGIEVYNFEVEDFHTYFVFADGTNASPILVHNAEYGHQATVSHVNGRGRTLTKAKRYASGNTGKSNPSLKEQMASHTEAKIASDFRARLKPGHKLKIEGTRPPCQGQAGGCQRVMRDLVSDTGATVRYGWRSDAGNRMVWQAKRVSTGVEVRVYESGRLIDTSLW